MRIEDINKASFGLIVSETETHLFANLWLYLKCQKIPDRKQNLTSFFYDHVYVTNSWLVENLWCFQLVYPTNQAAMLNVFNRLNFHTDQTKSTAPKLTNRLCLFASYHFSHCWPGYHILRVISSQSAVQKCIALFKYTRFVCHGHQVVRPANIWLWNIFHRNIWSSKNVFIVRFPSKRSILSSTFFVKTYLKWNLTISFPSH